MVLAMSKPATTLVLSLTFVTACHLVTGATDYEVEDGEGGKGGTSTGTGTPAGAGGTGTPTGAGAPTGTGAGTSTGSGGCDEHRDCALDQACFGGSCEQAYNREWSFTLVDGEAPTTDPNTGESWDPAGGAPDPYVIMRQGAQEIDRTLDDPNTFYPTWGESFVIVLDVADENISFEMVDKDTIVDPDDPMTVVDRSPSEWLQAAKNSEPGPYSWNDNGIIMNILIEPVQ